MYIDNKKKKNDNNDNIWYVGMCYYVYDDDNIVIYT